MSIKTKLTWLITTAAILGSTLSTFTPASAIDSNPNVAALSTNCAVLTNGYLDCWDGKVKPLTGPVSRVGTVPLVGRVTKIAGDCYLFDTGAVGCGPDGTLVDGLTATSISAGLFGYCAVTTSATITCWDYDTNNSARVTDVGKAGLSSVSDVAGDATNGCALLDYRTVNCWGGFLGNGEVSGLPDLVISRISVGGYSACVILIDSELWCWGENSSGQLGRPATGGAGQNYVYSAPQQVDGIFATSISIGADSSNVIGEDWNIATTTCIVDPWSHTYCWGSKAYLRNVGVDATDSPVPELTPITVDLSAGYSDAISTDGKSICAVSNDGSLYCWGEYNWSDTPLVVSTVANLPNPPLPPSLVTGGSGFTSASLTWSPTNTLGISSPTAYLGTAKFNGTEVAITRISGGGNNTLCGLLSNRMVACWGNNQNYYGNGGTFYGAPSTVMSAVPVIVNGLTNVKQLEIGDSFGCALLMDATVKCFGLNDFGELGTGTAVATAHVYPPTTVPGLTNVASISTDGGMSACAVLTNGNVLCWGRTALGNYRVPTQVPGVAGAKNVSQGAAFACALITDGTVSCWGHNTGSGIDWRGNGALGDGSLSDSLTGPTTVVGLNDAIALTASAGSACAIEIDGTILCWGGNQNGELGNGTTDDSSTPQPVLGIAKAVKIFGVGYGYCALDVAATPWCWGATSGGASPLAESDLAGSIDIGGSINTICNDKVCLGSNNLGELGSGNFDFSNGGSAAITTEIDVMCYTTDTTCTFANPPGATSVELGVQALNRDWASRSSDTYMYDLTGKTTPVTDLTTTQLSATVGDTVTLAATSTDATATPIFVTNSPGCTISGSTLTAASPVYCDVTAVTTDAVSGASLKKISKSSAPNIKSISTTLRMIFKRQSQASLNIANAQTNLTTGSVALTTAGGNGTGKTTFYNESASCKIAGSTLFATSAGTCILVAKKNSDATFDSAVSASKSFTFSGLAAQAALTLPTTQPTASSYTLSTNGGTGSGGVLYTTQSTGCTITAAVLSVSSQRACVVTAIKAGDTTHYAQASLPVVYKFPALASAPLPALGAPSAAASGYTIAMTNYNSSYTYTAATSRGTITKGKVSGTTLPFTIAGLSAGQSAVLTVTASRTGYYDAVVTTAAAAIAPTITVGTATSNNGGFTLPLSKLSPNYTYSATVIGGDGTAVVSSVVSGNASVTVSGVTVGNSQVRISETPIISDLLSGGYAAGLSVTATGWAKPVISATAANPTNPNTGDLGTVMTITGTNLWGASSVTIGTAKASMFSVLNSTTIMVGIWSGAKTGAVSVTTPGGTVSFGTTTITTAKRLPGLLTLSTLNGAAGTALVITGDNIGAASAVTIGKTSVKFKVKSNKQLVLSVPTGITTGSKVTVTTAGGSTTSADAFTFTGKVTPGLATPSASTASAGNFISYTGTNLGAVSGITFAGTAVANWSVLDANTVYFQIPLTAVSASSPAVVFTTPGGTVTATSVRIN